MSYREGYAFFEKIREIVAEVTGFECIRADDVPGAGEDLRLKIHAAIKAAAFVISDVSRPSPNIYYETGYAVACDKPTLVLVRKGVKIPTNLLGVEMIRYAEDKPGWERFTRALRQELALQRDSHVSLLRAMLMPQNPRPSYILADPKQPAPDRADYFRHQRKTYGDNLGVVGILSAFGSVYGEHCVPELLSAKRTSESIINSDASFYVIASAKTNPFTVRVLSMFEREGGPNWRFEPAHRRKASVGDEEQLCGSIGSEPFGSPCGRYDWRKVRRPQDCGIIVRGPNPRYPKRIMMVLAGPHSVGTGAACLAATKSKLIRRIAAHLAGKGDLAARDKTIWVLVKGKLGADRHLRPEDVKVVAAGTYEP
ncbi:MAG TPA: hypothetical protein VNE39_23025 [Planctomycetota bacterium]|nr:hypothetical protein [Planctomycetota bacterium]